MRILYFDCFSGASGDMILGACLDAGLPLEELRAALGSLGLPDYELRADRVLRAGVSATRFRLEERHPAAVARESGASTHEHPHDPGHPNEHGHAHAPEHPHETTRSRESAGSVAGARSPDSLHAHDLARPHDPVLPHEGVRSHDPAWPHESVPSPDGSRSREASRSEEGVRPHEGAQPHEGIQPHDHGSHRSLPEIERLIARSALSSGGRAKAVELVRRLAEVEAAIHQVPVERVHLHEVGALDSIIDIVGAVFAFEWFAADRVVVSPLNVGSGMVRSAHGVFPVPAPATVQLLGDAPVYSRGPQAELLTPTGALLLTGYASSFGLLPPMRIGRVGYGAGERDFSDTPNVLRLLVGEAADEGATERVVVLQCEIDDMNPQIYGVLMDQLHAAGAVDVLYQPVQMKKNRPGTVVTIVAPPEARPALSALVFRETTTIGIRYQEMTRERLEREWVPVETPFGSVRIKIARRGGAVVNAAPEFEDCARLAAERHVPVKDVQAAALAAWTSRSS